MLLIILVLVCMALFRVKIDKREKDSSFKYFVALALACFAIKMIASSLYFGHSTDMGCFYGWSKMLSTLGLGAFYEADAFTDYPPGYMYILWVLGHIRNIFSMSDDSFYLLLKMPAVLCDILAGLFIYNSASKRFSQKSSLLLSGIYMLNPAVVVNSSLWGQVDSVYTVALLGVLLLLSNKKLISSFFLFAVCVFIKPQSLIFTPVLLFSIGEYLFSFEFNIKKLFSVIAGGAGAIFLMIFMAMPFGILNVVKQYFLTIGSYPYLTVNAFNLWGALGQNWVEVTPYFSYLGITFIVVITLISARIFFLGNEKSRYFLTAAFLNFATFMLSVKMHDRYAFSSILMLLFGFIYSKRKDTFLLFKLVSMSQFFNMAWILFIYEQDINYYAKSPVIVIASVINLFILGFMTMCLAEFDIIKLVTAKKAERKSSRLKRYDYIIILCITTVYSVFALSDLGSMKAPETKTQLNREETVEIELFDEEYIASLYYYLGADAVEDDLKILYQNADGDIVLEDILEDGSAFYWNERAADCLAKKIYLTTEKDSIELFEIVLKNEDGIIDIKDSNFKELSDEQQMLPERVNFRNSTYFDEIYHARTGYEFCEGKNIYEWTHPPLGKVFIACGIKLFGMTPFGWRIIGTLFGIVMVFVMYALTKRIFKTRFIATVGTLLFTFDFMHFTQTRIATIDVYATFFIMLMYYFMYRYYVTDFDATPIKKTFKPLLFAGISFGFGAACKWTACYACLGLAVIFFITVIRRFLKNRDGFFSWFIKTSLFCVLAFIIIPIFIYCISYIPYMNAEGDFSFLAIWENQKSMLHYHGETVVNSTHPFSSKWYSWPIVYKPMWYYEGTVSDGIKEGISAFGNPVTWWLGIPSLVGSIYLLLFKKNRKALFLIIGYLSCLLPWVMVERTTYIYHYFPCVIFSVLMTCLCIDRLDYKYKRWTGVAVSVSAVALFLLFYPVLSGEAVAEFYVESLLKWLPEWILIG